jgi:hypothetical protein
MEKPGGPPGHCQTPVPRHLGKMRTTSLWLISTLSLPVYVFETFFVCFFVLLFFLLVYLFFPFPLTSLLSISSHPSILNITSANITARKHLIAHSTGTITTSRAMTGRQKKQGKQFPHSKKLIQEPERNEENRHSDPDSNKMKINYAKDPNEAHKNNLKEEILQYLMRIL